MLLLPDFVLNSNSRIVHFRLKENRRRWNNFPGQHKIFPGHVTLALHSLCVFQDLCEPLYSRLLLMNEVSMIYITSRKWIMKLNMKQDLKPNYHFLTLLNCLFPVDVSKVVSCKALKPSWWPIKKNTGRTKTHLHGNHKHVLFTWMYHSQRQQYWGNKQLRGFLGILQGICTVYHWHHLLYFMVFYLQKLKLPQTFGMLQLDKSNKAVQLKQYEKKKWGKERDGLTARRHSMD